jgi:FkbM family methyltransferase
MAPASRRFYSQHGEDYLLWHFFDFKRHGTFLDIGAYDGVTISNSLSFEESGWDGICVEANPTYAALCRDYRKRTIHAACTSERTACVDLRVDRSGLFGGITVDESLAARVYTSTALGDPGFETISVPAIRAAELVKGDLLDFVSIDVEGSEIDVLKGLDLEATRPRVLIVEANTDRELDKHHAFLGDFGYNGARSLGCNYFYVRSASDARKLRSITVDCELDIKRGEYRALAKESDRAWDPPHTATRAGFVYAKARQRVRRWWFGV